jgi:uncharacterized cupin superfamily protein
MLEDKQVPEAPLADTGQGIVPGGAGWFIVNVTEARAYRRGRFGEACRFESLERLFPEFGINVRVLEPGQPNCLYHREIGQEAFLVLSGECTAIVEEQERPMRAGDFLYAPPGTAHVMVGAGEGPCAILMVGTRKEPDEVLYPVSDVAARHEASVEEPTDDPDIAYAPRSDPEPITMPLPW